MTSPTTIRAMTDMPANTPRPIGRTDSFFPGMEKLPLVVCWAAAAVGEPGVEEVLAVVPVVVVGATAASGVGVGVAAAVTVEAP